MPGEDKNFGGSLVLDFRKWWRHVKTIYTFGEVRKGAFWWSWSKLIYAFDQTLVIIRL